MKNSKADRKRSLRNKYSIKHVSQWTECPQPDQSHWRVKLKISITQYCTETTLENLSLCAFKNPLLCIYVIYYLLSENKVLPSSKSGLKLHMAVSITYTEKEILVKVQPDAEYSAKYNPLSGWVITGGMYSPVTELDSRLTEPVKHAKKHMCLSHIPEFSCHLDNCYFL